MPTHTHYDIPSVDEQTPLDNGPLKIKWRGKDRKRVRRGLRAAAADGHERGVGLPVMTRQKTQIVIKTQEELQAFTEELEYKAAFDVINRIKNNIETQRNGTETASNSGGNSESEIVAKRREETDMEVLLNDVVVPHARKTATEVWPGGTVNVDDIKFFWNEHLTSSAGYAYYGAAIPRSYVDRKYDLAIGLAPGYYYQHGTDELLAVVRHELIHIWQFNHEMGKTSGGHGPDFKQWIEDADTHRHCKHW